MGDKRRLTIPPQMAYGTSGVRGTIVSGIIAAARPEACCTVCLPTCLLSRTCMLRARGAVVGCRRCLAWAALMELSAAIRQRLHAPSQCGSAPLGGVATAPHMLCDPLICCAFLPPCCSRGMQP